MRDSISNTAEFGDYVVGPKVLDEEQIKKRMEKILSEIQEGTFAQEFIDDYKNGRPRIEAERKKWSSHPIELCGKKLRAMMPWLSSNKKKAA